MRTGLINDEQHVALPKLYGAPAYGRPPRPVAEATPRPPDPDDLPLEAFRGLGDAGGDEAAGHDGAPHRSNGSGHSNGSGNGGYGGGGREPMLEPRAFSLRSLSRFLTGR